MYVAMDEIKEENKITAEMIRDAFNEKERPDIDAMMPDTKEEIIPSDSSDSQILDSNDTEAGSDIMEGDLEIKMETVSLDSLGKNTELVEIKDNRVLSSLTQIIPNVTQLAAATSNAIIAGKEKVYRMVLPVGETLAKAADGDGLRGFSRLGNNIKSHGRFYEVDTSASQALNATAAVMNIASIVVGQYYMSQINTKLDGISSQINKIAEFQEKEYKGKVNSLVSKIREITAYHADIIQSEQQCSEEIANINRYETRNTELLGQANDQIMGIIQEDCPDFKTYEDKIKGLGSWVDYQSILIEVLHQISLLKYTLHKGAVSIDRCSYQYDIYSKQVYEIKNKLIQWHRNNMKRFAVDLSRRKRKWDGFDGVLHFIPSIFDEEHNYDDLKEDTALLMKKHLSFERGTARKNHEFYAEDVQLVIDDGKWYYLAVSDAKRKAEIINEESVKAKESSGKSEKNNDREAVRKHNIVIAEDTIRITQKKEYQIGEEIIKLPDIQYKAVMIYTPEAGEELLKKDISWKQKTDMCNIIVVNEDSYAAASRYKKPLVMNFANAYRPGGGFKNGATAQEESLCRCSTLYASINSTMAVQMYSYNKNKKDPLASDYMLLSPSVSVFRDKDGELLKEPFLVSVITIPAPNRNGEAVNEPVEQIEDAMKRRIRIMLRIAIQKEYTNLVLGAWGCGAFGNDPYEVSEYFKTILIDEEYGRYFDEICFAVLDKEDGSNITAFRECFD